MDTGTQWLLDLCNGNVKEGCTQRIGSQVWYYYKGKDNSMEVDLTEGSNFGCVDLEKAFYRVPREVISWAML